SPRPVATAEPPCTADSSAADEIDRLPPPSTGREPSVLDALPPTPPDTSETDCSPAETLAVPSPRPLTSSSRSDHTVGRTPRSARSEEHTSELQSRFDLVCRLLLDK